MSNKKDKVISSAVIRRLPKYHRYLNNLLESGVERVSSQTLSEITGFTASQIRQDLNQFGGFGQQGYGYKVETLRDQIAQIIGLDQPRRVAVVGAGHLGVALANATIFKRNHLEMVAVFDINPDMIGTKLAGTQIYSMDVFEKILKEKEVDIVTITTPKHVAQKIADRAVASGVRGIWNYALVDLKLPEGVVLENVYLNETLHVLVYYMDHPKDYKDNGGIHRTTTE